jgi:hypothetical protein
MRTSIKGSAMANEIAKFGTARGITRICHFTPARNLAHMLVDGTGVLATGRLLAEERAIVNRTDLVRLDGFPDHVCCSIEYPNAWFFRTARGKEILFTDWVVLLIDSGYLALPGVKFFPRNAAAEYGRQAREGLKGFQVLYEPRISGAYGRAYERGKEHLSPVPTDEQAEVLIPDRINIKDILGVAVRDVEQARREAARLRQLGVSVPRLIVAPMFYSPTELSAMLRLGHRPVETTFLEE